MGKKQNDIMDKYREFKKLERKRSYGLDVIGMPEVGRVTLGTEIPIKLFRALRFGELKAFSNIVGESATYGLMYRAGRNVGIELSRDIRSKNIDEAMKKLSKIFKDIKLGIVTITTNHDYIVHVDECALSSGMFNIGRTICRFEVGLIAGILETILRKSIEIEETKCWGKGDECCEFEVKII